MYPCFKLLYIITSNDYARARVMCCCRYAVYIPLFLPAMIPVLLSLKNIRRYYLPEKEKGSGSGSARRKVSASRAEGENDEDVKAKKTG